MPEPQLVMQDGKVYVGIKLGPFEPDDAPMVLEAVQDHVDALNFELQMILKTQKRVDQKHQPKNPNNRKDIEHE